MIRSFAVTFTSSDGTNGEVSLSRRDDHAEYDCVVELPGTGVIVVRDSDVPLPRGSALEIRADGLWAEAICEVPDVHWSFRLEAFGLVVASRDEARTAERGDRIPFGYDLEWDEGRVIGELLVGRQSIPLDGTGTLTTAST